MFSFRKPKPTRIDQLDLSKDGPHKLYFEDGKKLRQSFSTKDGKYHGLFEKFDQAGNLILTCKYVDGKLDGDHLEYYSSEYSNGFGISNHRPSQVKSVAYFESGAQRGNMESFHFLSGHKFREFFIEDQKRTQLKEYNADGSIKFTNEGNTYRFYDKGELSLEANIQVPPIDPQSLKGLQPNDVIKKIMETDWMPIGTWILFDNDEPVRELHFDLEGLGEGELRCVDLRSGYTSSAIFEKGKTGLHKIVSEFARVRLEIQNASFVQGVSTSIKIQDRQNPYLIFFSSDEWSIKLQDFIKTPWHLPKTELIEINSIDSSSNGYDSINAQVEQENSIPNNENIICLGGMKHTFSDSGDWTYDEFFIYKKSAQEFIFYRIHEDTYSGEIGRNVKIDYEWKGSFDDYHTMGCLLMVLYWKDKCNYHQLENDEGAYNYHDCLESVHASGDGQLKPSLNYKQLIQLGTEWLQEGGFWVDRFFRDLHLLEMEDWKSICNALLPSENWDLGEFLMNKHFRMNEELNAIQAEWSMTDQLSIEESYKQMGDFIFYLDKGQGKTATIAVQWRFPSGIIHFKDGETSSADENQQNGELSKNQVNMIRSKIKQILDSKK